MYIIIVRLTYVALERWPGVFGDEGRKERKQKCCRVCFICLFRTWLLQWRGVCRVPCDSELVHPHKSIHRHALSLLTLACRANARFLPPHTTLPSPSRSQNARPQLPKQAIIHKHSTPPPFLLLYVDPVPAMPSQPITTSHPLTTPSIYPTKTHVFSPPAAPPPPPRGTEVTRGIIFSNSALSASVAVYPSLASILSERSGSGVFVCEYI